MVRTLNVDVLILGGGGAGLFCALHALAATPHARVAIAAKGLLGQSGCTRMVQGGYNAVLDVRDSFDLHFADTVKGGAFLNDQELAWKLVNEAPKVIRELERLGAFFDRNPDGTIYQKPFAGQSFDRTVNRGDLTGIEIMTRLKENVLTSEAIRLDEHRAMDLLPDGNGGIAGALLVDSPSGEFVAVSARAVVVATGGGARMYRIAAPSLEKAGDGMAMCFRAGVPMRDMEMYQFHPTGIIAGGAILTGAVLEEGLRGAGGYLFNVAGERYMTRYDPERAERSTRDVVSRSSYMEIQAGRGTSRGGVLLDVSHLGAEFVAKNFPGMLARCRDAGYDMATEPVEVSPTAHFHMGGARIDVDCRTPLGGLFVAGEDAGGVHGANRLGGNGVAESTVFGRLAGDAVASYFEGRPQPKLEMGELESRIADATHALGGSTGESPFALRSEVEDLMWDKVGLVRDGSGLRKALDQLGSIAERHARMRVPGGTAYNPAWQQWLDLRSILDVAFMTARSAVERQESRGSHYRSDFPNREDAAWLKTVLIQSTDGGNRVWTEPVTFPRLAPAT